MVETHCPLFPLVFAKLEFGRFLFLEQPPGMSSCLLEFYPLQRYTLPFPNSRLMLFSLSLSLSGIQRQGFSVQSWLSWKSFCNDLNSQSLCCLCLPSVEIKGVHHLYQAQHYSLISPHFTYVQPSFLLLSVSFLLD